MRLLSFLMLVTLPLTSVAQTTSLTFVTEELPPYQIVKENKLVAGSSYTLVKQAITLAKLDADIKYYPWARAFQMAKTTPNVIIFSMARTEERESSFLWLYKLQPLIYRFYSSANNNYDQKINVDNVQDVVAATVRGSFEETSLKQLGFKHKKNLVITESYESMWALLAQGKVDVVYTSHIPYTATDENKHRFVAHQRVMKKYDLYIAANKNSDKAALQKFIKALNEVKLHHKTL